MKVNAKFPAASPALRGVICLHDGADGELPALLDSATITAWRAGLAAALGTHALAGESDVVGVVGAGAHATLGEILRGDHPGRTDAPVGLPWQDLALSLLAWREAGRRGVGTEIDFLAGP